MTTVNAFNERFDRVWDSTYHAGNYVGIVESVSDAVEFATENLMLDSMYLGRRWCFKTQSGLVGLLAAGIDGAVVLLKEPCNLYAVGSYATTKAWLDKINCSDDFVMYLMIGDVAMTSFIEILDAAVANEDQGVQHMHRFRRQMDILTGSYNLQALCA